MESIVRFQQQLIAVRDAVTSPENDRASASGYLVAFQAKRIRGGGNRSFYQSLSVPASRTTLCSAWGVIVLFREG